MKPVRVKICGITNLEDALWAYQYGADAIGFIFSPQSVRFISYSQAKKIAEQLPPFINKVGVFLNPKLSEVEEVLKEVPLDTLQFHGKESPVFCRRFAANFKIIKAFFPKKISDLQFLSYYKVDAYLLDIPLADKKRIPQATLSYKIVSRVLNINERIIISGGLTPDNVGDFLKKFNPLAVDVARGVESLPGKKDRGKLERFIKIVKG